MIRSCTFETACFLLKQPDAALKQGRIVMLRWAVIFFVIALIAAFLGFGGIAGDAAGIAKILFFVFLVIAALSFLFGRRAVV